MADEPSTAGSSAYWDSQAGDFDSEPDHGLTDSRVAARWVRLLGDAFGREPLSLLDIGCGTGSLALVLAHLGHHVHGIDFSADMLAIARDKGRDVERLSFAQDDANTLRDTHGPFDGLICRHVLWALPNPATALSRWRGVLNRGGRIVLIEGLWHTGAGLSQRACLELVSPQFEVIHTTPLSADRDLWGEATADERYMIAARRR